MCNYCGEGQNTRIFSSWNLEVEICNDGLDIDILIDDDSQDYQYTTIIINYCPMCGRKLGD